jgi:hypothetical protein
MFRRLSPLLASLLLAGCAQREAVPDDIYASIKKCGMDGHIQLEKEGERQFRIAYLDPNSDYGKMDCVLGEARRLRISLGFVGNEAIRTD